MFENKRVATLLTAALLALVLFAGCTSGAGPEGVEPTAGDETLVREALVDDFTVDGGTGVVTVSGNLRDGCEELGEITPVVSGTTISITILATRPAGAICDQALVPFTVDVPLGTPLLEPGVYTIEINGVTRSVTVEANADTIAGEALVDRVTVLSATATTLEIEVAGNLPDGCTTLAGADLAVEKETLYVTITTRRPADQMCTEALVPFVETYSFDVGDVRAGDYTVDANGATAPVTIAGSGEDGAFTSGTALVDALQIAVLESFPVQIRVEVQGSLRDGCTTLAGTTQRQEGSTIFLDVLTRRPADEMCTQALVPFSESFAVDVRGLAAGTYLLDVNGATAEFTLDVDNEVGADPFAPCAFADPSQPSYANTTDGYCIQHPTGFVAEAPVPGVLIISDTSGENPRAALTVERQGPADGRNARTVAEAQLAQFTDGGAALTESTIDVGGEPALVFDGVPGATAVRQAFVIHDGMVYVLTLAPVDAAYPAAGARAEQLWLAAVATLTWLPG